MRVLHIAVVAGLVASALAFPIRAAVGQSLLDRSDNVSSDWVGNTGTLYFNFIHRFSVSDAPERKVTNFPTFLIATGIASRGLLGVNYATNSALAARYPNEWEFFGRYAPLQQEEGAPFDLGGQVDYNLAVQGVDGEVSISRRDGPLRLIVVSRLVADTLKGGNTRFAFGGGSTLRLNRFIALAGDAATFTNRGSGEKVAWSAGLHVALPNTPHTLSVHVSNANTATLQGLTRGADTKRYGFEFTIPITMSRFTSNPGSTAPPPTDAVVMAVPPRAADALAAPRQVLVDTAASPSPAKPSPLTPPAAAAAAPSRAVRDTTSRVAAPSPAPRAAAPRNVTARLKGQAFLPDHLEITAGSTITWKNLDQLVHTVAAQDKSFASPIIGTEGSFSHTFSKPGTYPVYCTVHPFMKATIVVK